MLIQKSLKLILSQMPMLNWIQKRNSNHRHHLGQHQLQHLVQDLDPLIQILSLTRNLNLTPSLTLNQNQTLSPTLNLSLNHPRRPPRPSQYQYRALRGLTQGPSEHSGSHPLGQGQAMQQPSQQLQKQWA
jgi:hypothetical protein